MACTHLLTGSFPSQTDTDTDRETDRKIQLNTETLPRTYSQNVHSKTANAVE